MRRILLLLLLTCVGAWAQPDYHFTTDWTSYNEERWNKTLGHLVGQADAKGLEIGAYEGRSSIWFLNNILTGEGAKLTCLDLFEGAYEAAWGPFEDKFDHNLSVAGLSERVVKVKGSSHRELRKLTPGSYDFIYIDGCHMSACALNDLCLAWPLLKPGGILIFDDYGYAKFHPKPTHNPKIAVDLFVKTMKSRLDILHWTGQLIVRKKPNSGMP